MSWTVATAPAAQSQRGAGGRRGNWNEARKGGAWGHRRLLGLLYGVPESSLGLLSGSDGQDTGLGLGFDPDRLVRFISEFWEADVDRRDLLRASAWTTSITPIGDSPTPSPVISRTTAGKRLGASDLVVLREFLTMFRRMDNREGGGAVRERLVRVPHHELAPLLTTEMTHLAGWMAYDCGLHGLSQRYLRQAPALARAGGDATLSGEILAAVAHQAAYLGHATDAIHAAQAAAAAGRLTHHLPLVAEAHVLEAHGHALIGDTTATHAALHRAHSTRAGVDPDTGPDYLTYLDEAYLAAKFGHAFRVLGDGRRTVEHAERSLVMRGGFERGRRSRLHDISAGHHLHPGPRPRPQTPRDRDRRPRIQETGPLLAHRLAHNANTAITDAAPMIAPLPTIPNASSKGIHATSTASFTSGTPTRVTS
jgi:hypothetical protein